MKRLARLAGTVALMHGFASAARSAETPTVVVAEIGPERLPASAAGRPPGTGPAGTDPAEGRPEPRRPVRVVYPSPYGSRDARAPELRTRSLQ